LKVEVAVPADRMTLDQQKALQGERKDLALA
jgi:hypothetical protein